MKEKYLVKNKLPKKILACVISLSVLTIASSESFAQEDVVNDSNIENKEVIKELKKDESIAEDNSNKAEENTKEEVNKNTKEDIKKDLEENTENDLNTTEKNDTSKEVIEWEKTSQKGEVKETKLDGSHYNELKSTKENDNGANTATFKKEGLMSDPSGNTNVNIDFIDKSKEKESRFGVFLYHKDYKNNIFVGYDRAGWFWEYKFDGNGDYYKGARVQTPKIGEKNSLSISIKKDGQLNATNNGKAVFDTTVIPKNVFDALIENRTLLLKLGSFNGELTNVLVKTDNQENVKEEEKIFEKGAKIDDSKAIYDSIEADDIKASIDTLFPRVKEYSYKGKTFKANPNFADTLTINGVEVKPNVKYEKISRNEAKYTLSIKNEEFFIDTILDVRMKVLKNQLHFNIVDIVNNNNIKAGETIDNPQKLISTIDFKDNFLASVSSKDEGAAFDGARMSVNTHKRGDVHIDVDNPMNDIEEKGYMYGFVTNKNLSVAVWSNSQFNYGGGSDDYTRLTIEKKTYGDENFLGINSSSYIYQLAYKNKDGSYKVFDERTWIKPSAKIAFADDLNDDGKIDWQDGAIAYRDIMNNPMGHEYVKDLVGQRIAMNFGSQAQNPFLTSIDGIKKVYLNTDGLGQMVLLKGYGSEGHDSGHLNYADIGKRMGGAEDFNKLLELGKKYGARIGIHVNASETYPESKYFTPDRLRKDRNGNFAYGWNWLDQGINIDAAYDLAYGRFNRFEDLKKIVGDRLDFIYVDVWGNGQSGNNNAWASHQLSKELNDLGWRAAFEWGFAGEYDSTFQHWAADLTYGGYSLKGINSNIVRFLRNHQKDSWVGNYPAYGGAAVNPLLGGYDMIDFEGWQGRNDWAGFIRNIFKTNLPTKFVQHYRVYEWKNGKAVDMSDNGESYKWTPEMEIKLRNEKENGFDELIINRKSNDLNDEGYMQRTMKLNGKVVFDEGKYLLPWEFEGIEKLYHFNPEGGKTSWDVLDGWSGKVYLYELTDLGKKNEKVIEIKNGKIELDAKANTAYVIYKENAKKEDIKWSEAMGIEDVGFNSKSLDHWDIKGDKEKVQVVLSQGANPMLKIADNEDEVSLTQNIKGLKANTQYAIYVGVDNRSDAKAFIDIKSNSKTYSNYTEKSIALNYVKANAHNTWDKSATVDNKSYFQNMYVYFTTGDNPEDVTLTLRRETGRGASYFDDLRVFENKSQMYGNNHDLKEGDFFQDFEQVGQGIFPFVIGGVEGVEDNRTHLAEKNAPYTQKGWNGKVINDVIDGNWSLKTNGLTGRNRLVYQTIPQNFRFEEGYIYQVAFDYEAGSDGTYAFVIGDGEYTNPQNLRVYSLGKSWEDGKEESGKRAKFLVEGGKQRWIGILSTTEPADTKASGGNEANFRSYKDFMLDNLLIRKVELSSSLLKENFFGNFYTEKDLSIYDEKSVKTYQDALAKLVIASEDINPEDLQKLIDDVYTKQNELKLTKKYINIEDIENLYAVAQGGEELENAFDGDSSTIWHSPWQNISIGESATVELIKPILIKNFTYLPRQSGANGRIKAGKLEIIDDKNNSRILEFKDYANDASAKTLEFEKAIIAKKIIITPTETYGDQANKFLSAAEFIFGLENTNEGHKAIDYDKLLLVIKDSNNKSFDLLKENFDYLKENDLISHDSFEKILKQIEEDKEKEKTNKNNEKNQEKPSDDKIVVDEKATEDTFNLDKGFDKKSDAIKQAEAIIKNSKLNKLYIIRKGNDGKYYIRLLKEEKPERIKMKVKSKKTKTDFKYVGEKKKSNNPKTGINSLKLSLASLFSAMLGLFISKKRK
ncbi:YSIRK signal domain/LPXTG anchor domain surface protein [Anaerococcus sp. WCA-380-WT-2B]|uniref:YSIRK signal domain/LPXTG anchor domain surface protein n=1 Tax=Anaerococcus porci TaxID=2652269 RepID=A0A6N7VDB9_9FIRM|nr:endo-alpha-N-acetylgalactosaminidase family protein [Anaerococcus porci]MSS77448.1 YSIRK signal domain/LPXTG anchor domain surface protein [Anaerococcus porci]